MSVDVKQASLESSFGVLTISPQVVECLGLDKEIDESEKETFTDVKPVNQTVFVNEAFVEELVQKALLKKRCGRPNQRLTEPMIRHALRIVTFDVARRGKLRRWRCPNGHSKEYVEYKYQRSDGVHVFCAVCGATSHFDEYNFHGSKKREDLGEEIDTYKHNAHFEEYSNEKYGCEEESGFE
jgi:hypothetical protein